MIEINLNNLQKGEKRIPVKGHKSAKGYVKPHIRVIKTGAQADVEMDVKLAALQNYKEAAARTNDLIAANPDRHVDVGNTYDYSVDTYDEINYYLREEKLMEEVEEEGVIVPTLWMKEDEIIEISDSISSFLHDAPKFTATTYRGMYFRTETERGSNKFNIFMENINNSKEITLKSFTSTSVKIEEAEKCIRKSKPGRGNIIFEIKSKNGIAVGDVVAFPGEREILFDKNSKFNIINVGKLEDNTYIKLEEI